MKYIYYLILFLFTVPISFGTYISEINFLDDEFIEIYSNTYLNLENATIQDENSGFNTLNLIQNKSSNFYLIVGTKFLNQNNISNLNCSIYSSGLTSPGKFGLKNTGENILINLSNTSQINFTKNQSYSFNVNQTLNFNQTNNSYFISNKSPCLSFASNLQPPTPNLTKNQTNITNNSIQNITNNISNQCNYNFKINPYKNITTDKIEFSFITNTTNFSIEYWVEDYENKIAKNKKTTTNKNKKTYTPKDFTNIYLIKAKLKKENCKLNDTKQIIYYSKTNSYLTPKFIEKIPPVSNRLETGDKISDKNQNSYILILNKEDIINNKTDILEYEVYKGNTLKRSIYIYHNKKKLETFQLKKYELKIGEIKFNKTEGANILKINGLELEDKIEFNNLISNQTLISNILKKAKSKNYFNISNFKINQNKINFNINSNLKNLTSICYILNKKTIISNILNLTENFSNSILNINNEKLKDINNSLKLLCKYKKKDLKTLKYFSYEFNYSKTSKVYKSKVGFTNINYSLQKETNTLSSNFKNNNVHSLNSQKETSTINYTSKNKSIKENSFYLIFIGVSSLLSTLIFLW